MLIALTLLSIVPYTISNWLVWQNMKQGTILPHGSGTARYGLSVGWTIKLLFFGIVIAVCLNYGWINLAAVPITWFVSGWLATLIERKVYMDRVMEIIVGMAEMYIDVDYDNAVRLLSVPEWWFKLMPNEWKKRYVSLLQSLKK